MWSAFLLEHPVSLSMTTCEYQLPLCEPESWASVTGEVSKEGHGSLAAFIKLVSGLGIVSSFWALQERGYPLGDIESEELKIVSLSLFFFFLPKTPENRQFTHDQNLIKFCFCSISYGRLSETTWLAARQASLSSLSPRACSDTCPFSCWCQPSFSSSIIPFSSCPQAFPASVLFSNESALCIRWPKYWSFSFSFSPSNEYSGLISCRIDWLDLLAVQGSLKSLFQHRSSKASVVWHSAFFMI